MKEDEKIPLRDVQEPPKRSISSGYNKHMKDLTNKSKFVTEFIITFAIYAIPSIIVCHFFYWGGASYTTFVVGYIVFGIIAVLSTYYGMGHLEKTTIMERCFYFNPLYTQFLLSHPVVNKRIIDRLNMELYLLCLDTVEADGSMRSKTDVRVLRRKAAKKVIELIREEINDTLDVALVRSKSS